MLFEKAKTKLRRERHPNLGVIRVLECSNNLLPVSNMGNRASVAKGVIMKKAFRKNSKLGKVGSWL